MISKFYVNMAMFFPGLENPSLCCLSIKRKKNCSEKNLLLAEQCLFLEELTLLLKRGKNDKGRAGPEVIKKIHAQLS